MDQGAITGSIVGHHRRNSEFHECFGKFVEIVLPDLETFQQCLLHFLFVIVSHAQNSVRQLITPESTSSLVLLAQSPQRVADHGTCKDFC